MIGSFLKQGLVISVVTVASFPLLQLAEHPY